MPFWPYVAAYPPCSGRALPGSARLQEGILDRFEASFDYGIYNCRPSTSNPAAPSIHSDGRAGDDGFPDGRTGARTPVTTPHYQGFILCELLRANAFELGIQGIIWNHRRFDYRTPWGRNYTGPNPHTDHVHWEQHPGLAVSLSEDTVDRIVRSQTMFTPQQEAALKELATYGTILTQLGKGLNTPGPTTGRVGNGLSLIHVLEAYRLVAANANLSPLDHAGIARLLGQ